MRFAIAASILAAQVLPTVTEVPNPRSSSRNKLTDVLSVINDDVDEKATKKNELDDGPFEPEKAQRYNESSNRHSFDARSGRLINKKLPVTVDDHHDSTSTSTTPTTTTKYNKNKPCNPNNNNSNNVRSSSSMSNDKADVGILETAGGCDNDTEYCMESKLSKLGGFCVSTKQRQEDLVGTMMMGGEEVEETDEGGGEDFYSRTLQDHSGRAFLYTTCEYHSIDDVRTCTIDLHCLVYGKTCYSGTKTTYFNLDRSVRRYVHCYDIIDPIETRICHEFVKDYNVPRPRASKCTITYNGEECSSCYRYTDFSGSCTFFDCTNVEGPNGPSVASSTCTYCEYLHAYIVVLSLFFFFVIVAKFKFLFFIFSPSPFFWGS